jgi:hypothetical protein
MYSWIPFFAELANKLLAYEARQPELVALLRNSGVEAGATDHDNEDKEFPLKGECQIFCVNPFFAFKHVHPIGPQNRSSAGSIS